jgi:mono/diheme cytochrome c family protein
MRETKYYTLRSTGNARRSGKGGVWAWVVLAFVAAGCGPSRRDEPFTEPLRASNAEVSRGEVAFMRHCHMCHPGGGAGLGPAINDKPLPGWLIRTQIRKGLGEMPAFDEHRVSDAEARAIVAYLKALRGLDARS